MISLVEMERGGLGSALVDSGPGPAQKSDFENKERVMFPSPLSVADITSDTKSDTNSAVNDVLSDNNNVVAPTPDLYDKLASEPLVVETKQTKSITPRGPKPGNKDKRSVSTFKTIGETA